MSRPRTAPVQLPASVWHCRCGYQSFSPTEHSAHVKASRKDCGIRVVVNTQPPGLLESYRSLQTVKEGKPSFLSDELLETIHQEMVKLLFRSRAQNHDDFFHDAVAAVLEAAKEGLLPVPEIVRSIVRQSVYRSRYAYDKFWDKIDSNEIPDEGVEPEWDEAQRHRVNSRVDDFWRVRRLERENLLAQGVRPMEASRRSQGYAVSRLAQDLPPIFRALTFLTTTQRNIVYWHYWRQLTQLEIGERLGLDQSSVSRGLAIAKKQLARYLTGCKRVPGANRYRGERN